MSQLAVRPGRNAARQAKKLKEIRHVKGAIVWHERERAKRQKAMQERWESKQAAISRIKWENDNVKRVRTQALERVREDWRLGALRPNRAAGAAADKYGALSTEQLQKPEIPIHTLKNRNEFRAKRGLAQEYPLVVDDKKYFHLERDDRVVVINGREKGKIGLVQSIVPRTHEVIVKGVNLQYYDSEVFDNLGEDMGPKVEREVPVSIHDVRLVVPYETRQRVRVLVNGKWEHPFATVYRDVVVDHIEMERHTTGIDPFTGTDYGDAEIPKDHQYDPETGLPIFHRYIAGTRHRIEWPWEHKEGDKLQDRSVAEGGEADKQTIFRKTLNTLRHPISSIKQLTSSTSKTFKTFKASDATTTEAVEAEAKRRRSRLAKEITMMEDKSQRVRNTIKPKSKDPRHRHAVDNTDTTRNIVEGAESMSYKLVSPPFPDTLFDELRSDIQDFAATSRKDETAPLGKRPKRATEQGILAREASRAKHAAAMKMKTPMQLRWEMEQAKKVKLQKTSPLVSTEELMIALGKHIQQGKAKKASRDEEAD